MAVVGKIPSFRHPHFRAQARAQASLLQPHSPYWQTQATNIGSSYNTTTNIKPRRNWEQLVAYRLFLNGQFIIPSRSACSDSDLDCHTVK